MFGEMARGVFLCVPAQDDTGMHFFGDRTYQLLLGKQLGVQLLSYRLELCEARGIRTPDLLRDRQAL
jgi:hypothetical protein